MPMFERHGAKLFYEVAGEGEPIIFTHGASWNHLQWNKQVEALRNQYMVIRWDVRGHGYSSLPEGPVDSEEFSADLIALMDHLNLDNAVLCGLSMGGHISLQTAIRYPDRVKGLVLIGTPCSNRFNLYEKIFVPINRFSSKLIPIETSAKLQAKMLSKINPGNYKYIFEAFNMIPHDNWNRLWSAVTRMESKNDLHRVKCKTLLLIGDHDNMTYRQQQYMAERIRDSELKVISNAHHGTNLDNPESVNLEIFKFIKDI
ncbi:alpha/beta fold hydrolase [Alkaliphilus peptidifermentans]|uniref:Pimeloyl-ACP methyl ester carboxylesterase n=1 Tax=Alkaliphilus peptidifermentans DSM 18978 TaxID=1120976 RepID=A0A1G5EU58_9FIRM|nr:alpha/beta hydrolase [Alkaliphilus peptidifermentans]SCY30503.1 Pimeloyl-ACP methyl ester carboxylesterase [Alkaliphilus peptidifermentans DSM 18978]